MKAGRPLPQCEAVEVFEPARKDNLVGKLGEKSDFPELGPGQPKSALDQDDEVYIGWLFGRKRQKYARIAKIYEKGHMDFYKNVKCARAK